MNRIHNNIKSAHDRNEAKILSLARPKVSESNHPILDFQENKGNQWVLEQMHGCDSFPERCPTGGTCHLCPTNEVDTTQNPVQPKLKIGEPGDKYEQEADRVADSIMQIQEISKNKMDEEPVQYAESLGHMPEANTTFESNTQAFGGGDQPLPDSVREFFEPRFGYDFSHVRVHYDSQAINFANNFNAHAFTIGKHIYFGSGKYRPTTVKGQTLLAHELTHTIQQDRMGKLVQWEGKPPNVLPLPKRKVKLEELVDGNVYHDPDNFSNPIRIQRSGNSIVIIFTGAFSGKPSIKLPPTKEFTVGNIYFPSGEDYLWIFMDEIRKYPTFEEEFLKKKTIRFTISKSGLIEEKYYKGWPELKTDTPGETKREFKEGLKTTMTEKEVTYSLEKGNIKLIFNRSNRVLKIVDAANPKKILFNSRKGGFKKLLDLQINPTGEGNIIVEDKKGKVFRLDFDLAKSFDKKFIPLKEEEFDKHDHLVKEIKKFGVIIKEEGRLISNDVLQNLKKILSGLSGELQGKIRKDKPEIHFTISRFIGESQQFGTIVIGGQTKTLVEDVTIIHEFTHYLYKTGGLSTDIYYEADIEDKAKFLKPQIEKAVAEDIFKKEFDALRGLSTNTTLNDIWLGMFKQLDKGKIPHFSGPVNARIIDLSDEGNYGFTNPFIDLGHPFDSVDEFVASFVSLATLKLTEFVAAVKAAKSGGKPVVELFRRAWDQVCKVINLGKNPF